MRVNKIKLSYNLAVSPLQRFVQFWLQVFTRWFPCKLFEVSVLYSKDMMTAFLLIQTFPMRRTSWELDAIFFSVLSIYKICIGHVAHVGQYIY